MEELICHYENVLTSDRNQSQSSLSKEGNFSAHFIGESRGRAHLEPGDVQSSNRVKGQAIEFYNCGLRCMRALTQS